MRRVILLDAQTAWLEVGEDSLGGFDNIDGEREKEGMRLLFGGCNVIIPNVDVPVVLLFCLHYVALMF